jgi:hypothetical protein
MPNPAEHLRIASAGWDRWAPVNLAAIGVHLAGAAGTLVSRAASCATQKGAGAMSVVKTALTAAALGATAYRTRGGKKMEKVGGAPVEGITEPAASTPGDVSAAQRQQRVAHWMIPVFTGALLVVVSSPVGEQQKPGSVRRGVGARVREFLTRPPDAPACRCLSWSSDAPGRCAGRMGVW